MNRFIFIILLLNINIKGNCQIIASLGLSSEYKLEFVTDKFIKFIDNNIYYYECNSGDFNLCYYPQQDGVECGFFKINDTIIYISNQFGNQYTCDFDYGSFKLYKTSNDNKNIYILNTNISGSGTALRKVYHNLFVMQDFFLIKYVALWGVFSNDQNFGDFNNDGKLDFLEVRYNKFDPHYKLTMKSLSKDYVFETIKDKYIDFKRTIDNGIVIINSIVRKWEY